MEIKQKPSSSISEFISKYNFSSLSKMVFSDPISQENVVIVPVAKIKYGFGYGQGRTDEGNKGEGGGAGAIASPVGYIEIHKDRARFRRIRSHPLVSIAATIAISGLILFKLFKNK